MKVVLERRAGLLGDVRLVPLGPLGVMCCRMGLVGLGQAGAFVQGLPYGRTSGRDPALVLVEGRGTCSSKHAFVASLAQEHGVEVDLMVGVYRMSGETDPPVGPVLAAHGLATMPEAHCYLRMGGVRLDLTGPGSVRSLELLDERVLVDLADKVPWHRRFVVEEAERIGMDAEALWAVREACIHALS